MVELRSRVGAAPGITPLMGSMCLMLLLALVYSAILFILLLVLDEAQGKWWIPCSPELKPLDIPLR